LSDLEAVKVKLGDLLRAEVTAKKSWYKPSEPDIPVYSRVRAPHVQPLSKYSKVIAGMKENNQFLLYVDAAAKEEALKRTA
jgi:hypothetical protein